MASKAKRRPSWKKNKSNLDLSEVKKFTKLLNNASRYRTGTKSSDQAMDYLFTYFGE